MKIDKITNILGTKVYTNAGEFFGEIEEANLYENKLDGWRIRIDPSLTSLLGGAKGVIIPHRFVKAIGDICIIDKAAMPSQEADLTDTEMSEADLI